ncbi:MAG: (Fe-S)-binding protein [Elusimicrobia bacterium]|nr:(Fe-S)-binding protein [Elusimicrobiota bacterium]
MKKNEKNGYESCTGCAVCVLSCPVWAQTHDLMMTNAGRAKALQAGAAPEDIRESLEACLLCGSCAPVCPSGVDTLTLTASLRAGLGRKAVPAAPGSASFPASGLKLFIPGPALRSEGRLLARTAAALEKAGFSVSPDDALSALGADVDAGLAPSKEAVAAALACGAGAAAFVSGEGFLLRYLRTWFPGVKAIGIGEAVLSAGGRKALKRGDFYVVDARAFNADQARLVKFYDSVRKSAGCSMSTTLQRAAMPAGPTLAQKSRLPGNFDAAAQARWLLGKAGSPARVVAESAEDMQALRAAGAASVLHVSELL